MSALETRPGAQFQFSAQMIKPHYLPTLRRCTYNPFIPSYDQDRISPYNINTISNRQVMRIGCHLIQYQILHTKTISNIWQKVRRITKETMRVKELIEV